MAQSSYSLTRRREEDVIYPQMALGNADFVDNLFQFVFMMIYY